MVDRDSDAVGRGDEGYLAAVEARFVALRGQGFALSARDVGRVLAWEREGVPLRIALAVVEEAMRRWRNDGARRAPTLGLMERSIEAAMKRRAERSITTAAATSDDAPWPKLRAAIEAAGADHADGAVRSLLRRVWATLRREEAAQADAWAVAARLDAELVTDLAARLAPAEAAALEAACCSATDAAGGARMSERARTERFALERARWLRERFGVPELLAVMLG